MHVCLWCLLFSLLEAKLCGSDIASVDANTLDILHISSLEDREQLLSAIYNALHPPSTITQTLDSLLGIFHLNRNVPVKRLFLFNNQISCLWIPP